MLTAIRVLREEPHDFTHLAIDTADALEHLIWSYIIERDSTSNKKLISIEGYGYGKGYTIALEEWERLCRELDRLRMTRNMGVILLGHSHVKSFKNPVADDYDRFQPRLHDKASGLLKGWVDMVGFYSFEETIDTGLPGNMRSRAKGVATGRRILNFRREAAYDAKRRYAVPDKIEININTLWKPIAQAVEQAQASSPDELVEKITAEQDRIGDDALNEMVNKAVSDAGADMARLAEILGRLKAKEVKAA